MATNNLITGLIAGAFTGTVAGRLVAPKPGDEARRVVPTRAVEWRSRSGDYVGILRQKIRRDTQANGVEQLPDEQVISAN